MEMGGQRHARSGWVQKISPPSGFDPRTVQPVVSHYTNYAIPAPIHECNLYLFCYRNTNLVTDFMIMSCILMMRHENIPYLLDHTMTMNPVLCKYLYKESRYAVDVRMQTYIYLYIRMNLISEHILVSILICQVLINIMLYTYNLLQCLIHTLAMHSSEDIQ